MYIKFVDSKTPIECAVKRILENVVELRFADKVVVNTNGFNAYADKNCEYNIGGDSYLAFTTVYRNNENTAKNNGYQLSNDGSVYEPVIPTTTFTTSVGGTLDGITKQQLTMYEQLKVPTPIPEENYEFSYWSPAIPQSGKIEGNKIFTAIFTSTLPPEPEPEPTPEVDVNLVARVETLEDDMKKLNKKLGGVE